MELREEAVIEDVIRAIAETFEAALGLEQGEEKYLRVQCLEGLSDAPQDVPLLQVHWMGDNTDPTTRTERSSFQGGLKQTQIDIQLWLFSTFQILEGEVSLRNATCYDRVRDVLLQQNTMFFGTTGAPRIRGFEFRTETVRWNVPVREHPVVGARIFLTIRVF
jgi:hypothetical protein